MADTSAGLEDTLILRRVSNIQKLRTTGELYYQEKQDLHSEGVPTGESLSTREDSLFNIMLNLTPHWDHDANRWSFYGTIQDLQNLQNRIGLVGKDGRRIEITEHSLKNRYDPFFTHKTLWTTEFLKGKARTLSKESPIEEFYMRTYKGRSDVKQDNLVQSKFVLDRSKLEIVSPQIIKEKKSREIDKILEGTQKLAKMSHERMKRIAAIIDPPGYNENYPDPDALKTLLYDSCINSEESNTSRFGTKTYQDRFLELAAMDNATIDVVSKIHSAIKKGIIKPRTTGYLFKGETIETLDGNKIKSDSALEQYYLSDKNLKAFEKLEDVLEATE